MTSAMQCNSVTASSQPLGLSSPMRNKRSSSSSSLDCQSLQSSLKRVRLSCSPGELRLQRDLRYLPTMGWQPEEEQDHKDATVPFLMDSNPRWYFHGHDVVAELQVLDPLRLMLSIQQQQHRQHAQKCSRLWIQIPRMYPHRPPVITRAENLAIDRVIIEDEPPGMVQGQEAASETIGRTVIYKAWSPVRQLGDLLAFLLRLSTQHPMLSRSSSFGTSLASSIDGCSSQTDVLTGPMTMTTEASSLSPTDVSLSTSEAQIRPMSSSCFMDEHKMDDFAYYKRNNSCTQDHGIASQVLLPNRFDIGYGKYCDPLELRSRMSHQEDPNAMEL